MVACTDMRKASKSATDGKATPNKRGANRQNAGVEDERELETGQPTTAATEEGISDTDESYEVQLILDSRVRHGKRQFKIRWKGFGPADDSWEDEENVDSPDLIAAFLKGPTKDVKSSPKNKKGKKRTNSAVAKSKPAKKAKAADTTDGDTEYEVSKIVDYVELKDGTRQFEVRWKGFSAKESTWEPEANLNCPDLIEKFLKLEQEKEDSTRETRTMRQQVYRYNPELTKRSSHRTSTKKSDGDSSCDDSIDIISYSHRHPTSSSFHSSKYNSSWKNRGSYSFNTLPAADSNSWYSKITSQCSMM